MGKNPAKVVNSLGSFAVVTQGAVSSVGERGVRKRMTSSMCKVLDLPELSVF